VSQLIKRGNRHLQFAGIKLGKYDTVILETGLLHTEDFSLEESLRRVSRRLVYEIDDAVFLLFPEKIAKIAAMSDHVIVGNTAIAEWIRAHNDQITIIPTCLAAEDYPSKWQVNLTPASSNKALVLGWVGSSGNVPLLKQVMKPMLRLASEIDVELRIISSRSALGVIEQLDPSGRLEIRFVDIDQCVLSQQLASFDVGIMPLPTDDQWSRYKCNAKMVQYMMTGLPTVASDVGFNRTLVDHGATGLLAANDEQWYDGLLQFLQSSERRFEVGCRAREKALAGYSVDVHIDAYETALTGN
jgi:glycosyltransferase involved in cell wall biosynthesis